MNPEQELTGSPSQVKILDCTLRDGGYYNDWNFSVDFARALVAALNAAGVDIIELGYKSRRKEGFFGLFRYCNEELLGFLEEFDRSEYAFMVDASEFTHADRLDEAGLNSIILPAADSHFSWTRIAIHAAQVRHAPAFVRYFREQGYKVCCNLMGVSLLSDTDLSSAINVISEAKPDVFYIADSFGSLYPDDVRKLVRNVRSKYTGALGIHTHENQGMAYANALAAIEEGVEYVDGTVKGMGRGAGNLHLEQFLQGWAGRAPSADLNPSALLSVIDEYVGPLKERYGWGFNYVYMLSGLKNIHPTYCQSLIEGTRYTMPQMSMILDRIPHEHRAVFNRDVFTEAITSVLESPAVEGEVQALDAYKPGKQETAVIVAGGPSLAAHIDGLEALARTGCQVIECNDTGALSAVDKRIVVILNKIKLTSYLSAKGGDHPPIVTGESSIASNLPKKRVSHLAYELGSFEVTSKSVTIPDYDAGMFAVGLAILNGAKRVYLAGFDGFEDPSRNVVMDSFFAAASHLVPRIEIVSLTPTRYRNVIGSSVYAALAGATDR